MGACVNFQGHLAVRARPKNVLRHRIATGLTVAAAACALCVPAAASAVTNPVGNSLTASVASSGTQVWVDVDSPSGLNELTGEIRNNAEWVSLPLQQTVFGFGAIASVQPGTVEVRLHGPIGAQPDLALTVVDAQGLVLAEARERVAVVVTPVPSTAPTTAPTSTSTSTLTLTDGPNALSSTPSAAGADGALAGTGVSAWSTVLVALAVLTAGFIGLVVRRRMRGVIR